jgi:hypothetical protein
VFFVSITICFNWPLAVNETRRSATRILVIKQKAINPYKERNYI